MWGPQTPRGARQGTTCNTNDNKPRNTRTRHPLGCCEKSQKYASCLIAEDRGRPASTVGSQSGLVTKINISNKSCTGVPDTCLRACKIYIPAWEVHLLNERLIFRTINHSFYRRYILLSKYNRDYLFRYSQ